MNVTFDQAVGLVTQYTQDKKILIADGSAAIRASVKKGLKELGVNLQNVIAVNSYEEAKKELTQSKPSIVICEYYLGDFCGLNLAKSHRENLVGAEGRVFVLLTNNADESTIAEAAEEDVDCFVLKPLVVAVLQEQIVRVIQSKLKPTPYKKSVNAAKTLIEEMEYADAIRVLSAAIKLDSKPTLAYYYTGLAESGQKNLSAAETNYREGLKIHSLHYKCTTGLFDVLVALNDSAGAYGIAKKMTEHFPISPPRLESILRLAVKTKNLDDIEVYHEKYLQMDYRTENLTKAITAGLLVATRFNLQNGHIVRAKSRALEALQISQRRPGVFKELILMFTEMKAGKAAEEILKEYPAASMGTTEYLRLDYVVLESVGKLDDLIVKGRKLIADGHHDPLIYEVLIRALKQAGYDENAESICADGGKRWPEVKEKLNSVLQQTQRKK